MSAFRRLYGASPLHLLAVLASFAIAGYGFFMIFKSPAPESTLLFFGLAIVAHDMIAFPLYSTLNLVAGRTAAAAEPEAVAATGVPAINYLRVPFIISAICLVMFFPPILFEPLSLAFPMWVGVLSLALLIRRNDPAGPPKQAGPADETGGGGSSLRG